MVVFVCSGCGASLKKNQVDFHTTKCRSCQYISCMDCGKDFWGDDYADHIKCITEAEKYGGSDFVSKRAKGDQQQEAWTSNIQEYLGKTNNINPELRRVLSHIAAHPNVPRKKPKFLNFAKALKIQQRLVEQAWNIISAANDADKSKENAPPPKSSINGTDKTENVNKKVDTEEETQRKRKISDCEETNMTNGNDSTEPSKKKKKNKKDKANAELDAVNGEENKSGKEDKHKRKKKSEVPEEDLSEDERKSVSKKKKKKAKQEPEVEQEAVNGETKAEKTEDANDSLLYGYATPFKWKTTITKCLQNTSDKGLKMSKLRKLVFSEYYAAHGEDEHVKSENELTALLNKKLSHRNDKYVVVKDRVKLRNVPE